MSDYYDQQLARAGPLEAPILRRSQYLAQLLQANNEASPRISSGTELGARLLAQALGQWGQIRNERALREARQQDFESNPILQGFQGMFGGSDKAQAPPPSIAPGLNDANSLVAALQNGTANRSTAGDPVPPPPAPPNQLDERTQDTMARLLIGEAPREGRQAVANVIFNRSRQAGMNPYDVMTQRHQFEPYGNRQTWQRLQGIDPNSPEYQHAIQAIQQAQEQDVTNGATHFYSPQIMAQRGGPPSWARGQQGVDIGGNRFLNLPFSAPPGYQANQSSPAPPLAPQGAPPAQMPGPPPAAGGQPPVITQQQPQAPQGAQAQGMGAVTPQEVAYVQRLLADPRTQQEGLQMAQQLQQRAMAPVRYNTEVTGNQSIRINPITGQAEASPIQGFVRPPPDDMEYGPDGRLRPRAGTETRNLPNPQQHGYQPGTVVQEGPGGRQTVTQQPRPPQTPQTTFRPATPEEQAQYGGPGQMDSAGRFYPAQQGRRASSSAVSALNRDWDNIASSAQINSVLSTHIGRLDRGELNLGPMSNLLAEGRNRVGMSDPGSSNFASFRADMERLRNDSLRLNAGVQTDGDAQRAWNELFANMNDERVVRQRLQEIQQLNQLAIQIRIDRFNQTREDLGLAPVDPLRARTGQQPRPGQQQAPAQGRRLRFNPATGGFE